jgi:hypothetical protein
VLIPEVLIQGERADSDQVPLSALSRISNLSVPRGAEGRSDEGLQDKNECDEIHCELNTAEDEGCLGSDSNANKDRGVDVQGG